MADVSFAETESYLAAAKAAQLPRNTLINVLNAPNFRDLVVGAFVKVLLELPNRREDYMISQIEDVEQGERYSGFSQNASQSTTFYLKLALPMPLVGINGPLYQLNSISNSVLSQDELGRWLGFSREGNTSVPSEADLLVIAERIRPHNAAAQRHRQQQHHQQHQQPVVAAAAPSPLALGLHATITSTASSCFAAQPPVGPTVINNARRDTMLRQATTVRGSGDGLSDDLPSREQVTHQILTKLRETNAMFPDDLKSLKTTQLRVVERDLIEYLDRVRDALQVMRPNCVVCMDSVPTVILLPCKHRALCRLCATQVRSCPVCRQAAVELFEAVEI
jgi:hypothetical protein